MSVVRLATYQSCSFAEKRAVLQTFWTGRKSASDKINRAAREYGPYAYAMVAVITAEFVVITVVLAVRTSGWTWAAATATVLSLWSLWWTRVRHRGSVALASPGSDVGR